MEYDMRFVKVFFYSFEGDKVEISLPVKAVRNILRASGGLPINEKHISWLDINQVEDKVKNTLENKVIGVVLSEKSNYGEYIKVEVV